MRTTIAFAVAATFVTGCASTPAPKAAEVPMYSASEWTAMSSEATLPEVSEIVAASNDQQMSGGPGYTGYSYGFESYSSFGGAFRSYGGGSAVHGAIASVSGHASVSSSSHASSGAHAGGHGGH